MKLTYNKYVLISLVYCYFIVASCDAVTKDGLFYFIKPHVRVPMQYLCYTCKTKGWACFLE